MLDQLYFQFNSTEKGKELSTAFKNAQNQVNSINYFLKHITPQTNIHTFGITEETKTKVVKLPINITLPEEVFVNIQNSLTKATEELNTAALNYKTEFKAYLQSMSEAINNVMNDELGSNGQ